MENLELKITVTEMKSSVDRTNNKWKGQGKN